MDKRKLTIPPRERDKNKAATMIIVIKNNRKVFANWESSSAHL